MELLAVLVAIVLIVYVVIFLLILFGYLLALLYSLTVYILGAVSYMKIAKKIGVPNGWLAFIPVASLFLTGKFAEEHDKRCRSEKKGPKWSLIYPIVYGGYVVYSSVGAIVYSVVNFILSYALEEADALAATLIPIGLSLFYYGAIALGMVAMLAVGYIITYKIYHMMAGRHAVWMLILSILVPPAEVVILLVLAFSKRFPLCCPESI